MIASVLASALAVFTADPAAISSAPDSQARPQLVPSVIFHGPDRRVLESLKGVAEIWLEADGFSIGALAPKDLAELAARGVRAEALAGIESSDELFLADLEHTNLSDQIDPRASVVFRHGKWGLVRVPETAHQFHDEAPIGHACTSTFVAITRRPMAPLQPTLLRGVPFNPQSAALLTADPRIQALVNQVSKTNLESYVVSYSSYPNRASTNLANFNAAKAQLIAQLQSYGYSPLQHGYDGQHGSNVYVERIGSQHPNEYVVVGAHFDTLNYASGPGAECRGADDNTSGSAGLLELARVLASGPQFERSIRLVWFSGEEYGLLGSSAHVRKMELEGTIPNAMLNMDMIAYREPGDAFDCDMATNSTSPELNSLCQQICPLYVSNWAVNTGPFLTGDSDHSAFTTRGVPAVIFREDFVQHFPSRHTPLDAYPGSTTDFDLAEMIVRGVTACVATIADPTTLVMSHAPLSDTTTPSGPFTVDASVSSGYGSNVTAVTLNYRVQGAATWSAVAMSHVAGSNWSAAIPPQGSPVVIEYFISATDDQGATQTLPDQAGVSSAPFQFFVGFRVALYSQGFDGASDAGWTHSAATGNDDWARGAPLGRAGDPYGAYAGDGCWGTRLGSLAIPTGLYSPNSNSSLRSPLIDCSGASSVVLEFRRWLRVEGSPSDRAVVRVNGQLVWQNPSGVLTDSEWARALIDISAVAANQPAVQIEFGLESNGSLNFGGWNIDELSVSRCFPDPGVCPVSTYCTGKLNSAGCTPQVTTSGFASAAGALVFAVGALDVVNQKSGVLFYGFAPGAVPFKGGYKCIAGPVKRCPKQSSGGSTGPADCSGVYSFDFNARIRSGVDPALAAGIDVYAQWWYRDAADPTGFGTGLSNAAQFHICP